jgi:hypothetical protein
VRAYALAPPKELPRLEEAKAEYALELMSDEVFGVVVGSAVAVPTSPTSAAS